MMLIWSPPYDRVTKLARSIAVQPKNFQIFVLRLPAMASDETGSFRIGFNSVRSQLSYSGG